MAFPGLLSYLQTVFINARLSFGNLLKNVLLTLSVVVKGKLGKPGQKRIFMQHRKVWYGTTPVDNPLTSYGQALG